MSYPSSVASFTPQVDGVDYPVADDVNSLQTEITAIEEGLINGLEHALLPDSTGGNRDLGASSQKFRDLHLSRLLNVPLVNVAAATELTIATGAVTVTQSYHKIDTEADAASDDLDTITAGTGVAEGSLLILRAENVSRVVTLKDGSGNLLLNGDYALSATDRSILLYYDGTNWREVARSVETAVDAVLVHDRDVTVATVNNTTTPTTIYSKAVAGNTLGTTRKLRVEIIGSVLNNSAGAITLQTTVTWGGNQVFDSGAVSIANNANARYYRLVIEVSPKGATNSQVTWVDLKIGATSSFGGTNYASPASQGAEGTTQAVDTTASATLAAVVTWGSADSNATFTCHSAHMELI